MALIDANPGAQQIADHKKRLAVFFHQIERNDGPEPLYETVQQVAQKLVCDPAMQTLIRRRMSKNNPSMNNRAWAISVCTAIPDAEIADLLNGSGAERAALARNQAYAHMTAHLAGDPEASVRMALAKHTRDEQLQLKLAADDSREVVQALAENPACAGEILHDIVVKHKTSGIRGAAAANENISHASLMLLVIDRRSWVIDLANKMLRSREKNKWANL